MAKLSDLRLSKNMKYTALYVAMRFYERISDVFEKRYDNGAYIKIDCSNQSVYINERKEFELNSHESFVKLECVNRILSLGYNVSDFSFTENENTMLFKGYSIQFVVWDDAFDLTKMKDYCTIYKSRLVSGVLEYKTKIQNEGIFEYGLFEKKDAIELRKQVVAHYNTPDFVIEENRVMRYTGHSSIVVVPEGIEELESSAFWDNQYIENVILPNTLTNMGGDTFYNCKNLKKMFIPPSVSIMGNNPFAGCPLIEIINESPSYIYEKGALYTADKTTMIYCSIKGAETEFVIPEGVTLICKHAFFLCDRFERITLPCTLEKMENNPFSGCSKLELINNSSTYFIKDDVIYNGFKTSVIGTLNKIKNARLELIDGVKTINRNSFWNCKGIETIVFPESLIDIGYNPFVGCSNIRFESKSPYFKVVDEILYNKDMSKIICYPAWKAEGSISLLESVITLERGAFSGCYKMTEINLHNANIVNKSCFTNCKKLERIYCADLITYIGEWAFAYCESLKEVSVGKDTIIDNNAFSNCPARLIVRNSQSNYLFESNNIYTLSSMQKKYKGKIDSILIDPPYNSNISYIGYQDSDYENGYYNFMLERLKLAYNLLSNKGFLVINIDEGEVDELANMCKTLFGEELTSIHKWKKRHTYFDINRIVLNAKKKQTDYEYIIICRKSSFAVLGQLMQPYIEDGQLKEALGDVPETFDCFGTTSSAKDEIQALFGRREYFSTPKPQKLMKELIRATTSKDSIVLDFFAGSGTVGHACLELNHEDGGERSFILVSNSESNISEDVTRKRMEIATKKHGDFFVYMK